MGVVRLRSLIFLVEIALFVALVGCGGARVEKHSQSNRTSISDVAVNVKLSSKEEVSGLALVGGANYTAEIVGCKSGLSFPLLDNASANVRVLNGDRECVFELRSFGLDGEQYDLAGKSFAEGSIFEVVGDQGSKLEFTVISNLDSPVDGDQLVRIIYGLVQEGSGKEVDASVNAGIQIEGASPIGLEIKKVVLQIHAMDGAGLIQSTLECDEDLSGGKCMGIDPASIKAGIAKDSYGGVLNLSQCLAIAQAGQNLSLVALGNSIAPHGGGQSAFLKGPAPLFGPGNSQMILALAPSEDSCKYFEVEILRP